MGRSDPEVITIDDVRAAGHCVRGARAWCELYGFDFRQLLDGGIPLADFSGIECALLSEIIERKRNGQ